MNSSERILVASITGLATGLILGLLFAPEKGSVTRQRVMDTAADLKDRIKSTAQDTYNRVSDLSKRAQNSYEKISQEADEGEMTV